LVLLVLFALAACAAAAREADEQVCDYDSDTGVMLSFLQTQDQQDAYHVAPVGTVRDTKKAISGNPVFSNEGVKGAINPNMAPVAASALPDEETAALLPGQNPNEALPLSPLMKPADGPHHDMEYNTNMVPPPPPAMPIPPNFVPLWVPPMACDFCQTLFREWNFQYKRRSSCTVNCPRQQKDMLKDTLIIMEQIVREGMGGEEGDRASENLEWWIENGYMQRCDLNRIKRSMTDLCSTDFPTCLNYVRSIDKNATGDWWSFASHVVNRGCQGERFGFHFGGQCPPYMACQCLFPPEISNSRGVVQERSAMCPTIDGNKCNKRKSGWVEPLERTCARPDKDKCDDVP